MLINEWQLDIALNQALQQQRRADFQLWLSLLSPAVEEQAEFCLQDDLSPEPPDLRVRLQLPPERPLSMQAKDSATMLVHNEAFLAGGFSALRLSALLQPAPSVVEHNANKLSADLKDNLSLHTLRRLQARQTADQSAGQSASQAAKQQHESSVQSQNEQPAAAAPGRAVTATPTPITPDPTLLYDVLQQLHGRATASPPAQAA